MKENDSPCLFCRTKPCSLSTEGWTASHPTTVSAAEMTENEIQFARRDEAQRDDVEDDVPEESG